MFTFNNFSPAVLNEQRVFEDIIVESIQIMGHDIKYLPRESYDATDEILGESPQAKFEKAYTIEAYLANVEGYEGDGDFFSKFGLEIRDTSNFVLSRRAFEKYVPTNVAKRPREGDLIWVPTLNKIFEIKFVEEELLFFALGKRTPYIYELRCEVFRFSNEDFNTGVEEVDDIELDIAYTVMLTIGSGSGNYERNEIVYQGASLASSTVSAAVKEWNPTTKKLQVINVKGEFTANSTIIGNTTGSSYTLTSVDTISDSVTNDDSDNRSIQTEAEEFIDLSEINPFGLP